MQYKLVIPAAFISFTLTLTLPMMAEGIKKQDLIDSHTLKEFDLNGILKEIDEKTKQLGAANQDILQGLLSISDKSSKTKEVSQKLKTVMQVAGEQSSTLGEIEFVTGEQVTLSQNLNALSKRLRIQMDSISASGQSQVDLSSQLKGISLDTLDKLREAIRQNDQLENKLKSAASKSDRAARSLP
ncbi:hypothetical protein SAMN05444955_108119 [Lihuaxuella thermophila]|uniref:Uncharacterized protein n=1 Tax=Lihuaxuella thermophila TaxID=1173111 RepID=A0A1H8FCI8_9BACL|nr:hypothetical protein SAMN05444955_108119 [Lihuaxuella thermophila]